MAELTLKFSVLLKTEKPAYNKRFCESGVQRNSTTTH